MPRPFGRRGAVGSCDDHVRAKPGSFGIIRNQDEARRHSKVVSKEQRPARYSMSIRSY